MSKVKTKRKTGKIIAYSILITLIIVLAASITVAGFIKTEAAPKLDKPYSIQLISEGGFGNSAVSTIELTEANQENIDKLHKAYSEMTDFSVLRGIFENEWFRTVKLNTYKDDDDKTQFVKLNKDDINTLSATPSNVNNESIYLVVYRYFDQTNKSVTIDKQAVSYNTVYFFVRYTDNEIASFKMYFVDSEAMNTDEDYETYEITAYGQLSRFYNLIEEIKEA